MAAPAALSSAAQPYIPPDWKEAAPGQPNAPASAPAIAPTPFIPSAWKEEAAPSQALSAVPAQTAPYVPPQWKEAQSTASAAPFFSRPDAEASYMPLVLKHSQAAGVDPEAISAIIDHESAWNPKAVNRANRNGTADYGIMQVNSSHNPVDWENPDANIGQGTGIFTDALRRAGGDYKKAFAIYNGGPGGWQSPQAQKYAETVYSDFERRLGGRQPQALRPAMSPGQIEANLREAPQPSENPLGYVPAAIASTAKEFIAPFVEAGQAQERAERAGAPAAAAWRETPLGAAMETGGGFAEQVAARNAGRPIAGPAYSPEARRLDTEAATKVHAALVGSVPFGPTIEALGQGGLPAAGREIAAEEKANPFSVPAQVAMAGLPFLHALVPDVADFRPADEAAAEAKSATPTSEPVPEQSVPRGTSPPLSVAERGHIAANLTAEMQRRGVLWHEIESGMSRSLDPAKPLDQSIALNWLKRQPEEPPAVVDVKDFVPADQIKGKPAEPAQAPVAARKAPKVGLAAPKVGLAAPSPAEMPTTEIPLAEQSQAEYEAGLPQAVREFLGRSGPGVPSASAKTAKAPTHAEATDEESEPELTEAEEQEVYRRTIQSLEGGRKWEGREIAEEILADRTGRFNNGARMRTPVAKYAADALRAEGHEVTIEPEQQGYSRLRIVSKEPPSTPASAEAPEPRPVAAPIEGLSAPGQGSIYTSDNQPVGYHWEVRPVGDIVTSHTGNFGENPAYDQGLQPRDRSRIAGAEQVIAMSQQLTPERLGESPSTADGAPIVGPDMQAESGNGRTMAIRTAYLKGGSVADAYRSYVQDAAEHLGMDADKVKSIPDPILVRVRDTPEVAGQQRYDLADRMGRSTVGLMSEPEKAIADAKRITANDLLAALPPDVSDLNSAAARPFVRGFLHGFPVAERMELEGANGELSTAGLRRVRNAVLGAAYGGEGAALERMTESLDDNVRGVGNGMTLAAPAFARLRRDIAAGARYPGLDITPDIAQAANTLSYLRDIKRPVEEHLATQPLLDRMSPIGETLLRAFDQFKARPKVIAAILQEYARAAELIGDPTQGTIFGDAEPPSAESVLTAAIQRVEQDGAQAVRVGQPSLELTTEAQPEARRNNPPAPAGAASVPAQERPQGAQVAEPELADLDPAKARPAFSPPVAGGAPGNAPLSAVGASIAKKIPQLENVPQRLADAIATGKDLTSSGLNMLKSHASPETVSRANELAAVRARVAVQFKVAYGEIAKILGRPADWTKFLMALSESRLRGIRERWSGYAHDASVASDDDLVQRNKAGEIVGLAEPLQGPLDQLADSSADWRGVPQELAAFIEEANRTGDLNPLRQYAAQAFHGAAANVPTMFSGLAAGEYDRFTQSAKFQQALAIYKREIEPALASSHASNEGVFSNSLGPLDTYYPLTARDENGEPVHRFGGSGEELRPSANIHNNFATGQSPAYDASPESLRKALAGAFRRNSQAALVRGLVNDGLVLPEDSPLVKTVSENGRDRLVGTFQGKQYPAIRVMIQSPTRVVTDEGSFWSGGKSVYIPEWLRNEIGPLVHSDFEGWGEGFKEPGKIVNAISHIAITGPTAAVFHTANLGWGMLKSFGPGVLGAFANGPLAKLPDRLAQAVNVKPGANLGNLREMAETGALPERYADVTTSREVAEATGTQYAHPLNPLGAGHRILFGESGLDVMMRLQLWRTGKVILRLDPDAPLARNPLRTAAEQIEMNNLRDALYTKAGTLRKKADPQAIERYQTLEAKNGAFANPVQAQQIADYVTQTVGQYNAPLQSVLTRALRRSIVGNPFAVASQTFLGGGVKQWSPLDALNPKTPPTEGISPGRAIANKMAEQAVAGAAALTALWMIAYKMATGKSPLEDKRAKFLQLPVGADTRVGKRFPGASAELSKLEGTQPGEEPYLNLAILNPTVARGANALGITNAFNAASGTGALGGPNAAAARKQYGGLIEEEGLRGAINGLSQPFTEGPALKAITAALGFQPYITHLRDLESGMPVPQFERTLPASEPGLGGQIEDRALAGAAAMNPIAGAVLGSQGIGPEGYPMTPEQRIARGVVGLVAPRLMGYPSSSDYTAATLTKEQQAAETSVVRTQILGKAAQGKDVTADIRAGAESGKISEQEAMRLATQVAEQKKGIENPRDKEIVDRAQAILARPQGGAQGGAAPTQSSVQQMEQRQIDSAPISRVLAAYQSWPAALQNQTRPLIAARMLRAIHTHEATLQDAVTAQRLQLLTGAAGIAGTAK
jgi:hypothetical protein